MFGRNRKIDPIYVASYLDEYLYDNHPEWGLVSFISKDSGAGLEKMYLEQAGVLYGPMLKIKVFYSGHVHHLQVTIELRMPPLSSLVVSAITRAKIHALAHPQDTFLLRDDLGQKRIFIFKVSRKAFNRELSAITTILDDHIRDAAEYRSELERIWQRFGRESKAG